MVNILFAPGWRGFAAWELIKSGPGFNGQWQDFYKSSLENIRPERQVGSALLVIQKLLTNEGQAGHE